MYMKLSKALQDADAKEMRKEFISIENIDINEILKSLDTNLHNKFFQYYIEYLIDISNLGHAQECLSKMPAESQIKNIQSLSTKHLSCNNVLGIGFCFEQMINRNYLDIFKINLKTYIGENNDISNKDTNYLLMHFVLLAINQDKPEFVKEILVYFDPQIYTHSQYINCINSAAKRGNIQTLQLLMDRKKLGIYKDIISDPKYEYEKCILSVLQVCPKEDKLYAVITVLINRNPQVLELPKNKGTIIEAIEVAISRKLPEIVKLLLERSKKILDTGEIKALKDYAESKHKAEHSKEKMIISAIDAIISREHSLEVIL